ncbi:MAG: glutathione ABC transporter substrate-binding protein [Trueperaceae bacterium]|nr:MAG: glutathione ABC transporter substrate-binding protein [Trueperaceae bacterium]
MFHRSIRTALALVMALTLTWSLAQTITIAQGTDAVSLDPHDVTDSPSATVVSHMYETLFDLTPEGDIVPYLATGADLSSDGLTWTVTLREDVVFHDGTPMTAEVVKGSMDRFLDPDNAFTFRFLLSRVTSIDVVDDYTLTFTLSDQFAPFLAHLTHNTTAIVLPAAVEEFGEAFNENPVGTGPFSFVSWDRGSRIDLERFDGYWGEQPGISDLVFLAVPENTTRMALVESGEADVAVRVPPQDIARLNANPNITVENVSSLRTIYIYFNHTMEPFTDRRVRQAVNYAVNKDEIAEFIFGGAVRPSDAAIAPGIFGYTSVGPYEYDPERARALLAEAGFPDGFSTTLYSPSGRYLQDIQTTEAIQSQLAEVGINAEIETLEWSSYLDFTNRPPADNTVPMAMLGWGTVTGDADYGLYALFHTDQHVPAGSNRSFYSNALVDQLLDDARSTADDSLREQLYADVLQLLHTDAAWLFLHSETQLVAVRDGIEGLVIHPTERVLALTASKN